MGGRAHLPEFPLSSLSFLLTPLPSLSVVPQQPHGGNQTNDPCMKPTDPLCCLCKRCCGNVDVCALCLTVSTADTCTAASPFKCLCVKKMCVTECVCVCVWSHAALSSCNNSKCSHWCLNVCEPWKMFKISTSTRPKASSVFQSSPKQHFLTAYLEISNVLNWIDLLSLKNTWHLELDHQHGLALCFTRFFSTSRTWNLEHSRTSAHHTVCTIMTVVPWLSWILTFSDPVGVKEYMTLLDVLKM